MPQILSSGEFRNFESGAVRDIQTGKGRCDLLPLSVVASLLTDPKQSEIVRMIHCFMTSKNTDFLKAAIQAFIDWKKWSIYDAMLEVSKHYEEGALKYEERNWEKGIDLHCYIDSGVRHLLKCFRGDDDEPHDRAFIWNMLGAIHTAWYLDLDDIHLHLSSNS